MASLEEIRRVRISKLEELRKSGSDPYPAQVKKTHSAAEIHGFFDTLASAVEPLFLCGRVRAIRSHGGSAFLDIEDESGQVQIFLQEDRLGQEAYKLFQENTDLGDFVEVSGRLFKTKKDEKTLECDSFRIIVKTLRPLPEEWYGLKDTEERLRHRYLDLILNKGVKEVFRSRSRLLADLRKFLTKNGFNEVETNILQPLAGGAMAQPFQTHLNALDVDLYLRVAPELYLKRLLVGGLEKIFEIGRCFRNEGISPHHNPEFTMLELYWAYQDYKGLMKFTQKLLKKWVGGRWPVKEFSKVFKQMTGRDYTELDSNELDNYYKKEVRAKIEGPLFLVHYPERIMPLAKLKPDNPKLTESFQLIVKGAEVAKGFSEMNDPLVQREQMERQEEQYRGGNKEVSRLDEGFLEALEYGMPPAAGLGVGLDRLAALVGGQDNIRDVILFPFMRPKD
ncbi:MAG: lysine--tRNA ligase [Parcubacteria group bacterium]|nr:lysine--tRNA ligase [Parcubacteria group bacterium]